MKKGKIVLSMILLALGISGCSTNINYEKVDRKLVASYDFEDDYIRQPVNARAAYKEYKDDLKAIFMTGNTLGYKPRFEKLMDLIDETEINGVVVDVKDDFGHMTYESTLDIVEKVGAVQDIKDKNFDRTMNEMLEKDIYPIARIVTFKDRTAAGALPEYGVKNKNGGLWRDNKGDAWLNPYLKSSWDYPIQIAEEAALRGFKEIQFDYVRFPTDGKRDLISYDKDREDETMAEAIANFLAYARERLSPYGVVVSADVFGLVTTNEDDMRLGQHLETLATSVDIICPMVYPSHYALGTYGVKYPDSDPYSIVKKSMEVAQNRIDNLETKDKKAVLRPWLQDFSAPWLRRQYGANYVEYGPEQIKAQKKATYDVGINEWIFWNASNRYTEAGYEKVK